MSKAVVFFAEGTEECEALLVVDLLRRAKVEVTIASATGNRAITSSHKVHITADALAEDIDNDVNYFLVVLGGKTIGYFAWKMENTALHLMHLYLRPEYRGKALGRDIVLSCERLARGEGKGRVWCTVHAKALPVQQFFKALRYRNLKPAEQENGTVPRDEVVFEHTLG